MADNILSIDFITSSESIVCLFFAGVVLRFGFLFADWCLSGWKELFHFLKMHFQVQKRKTDYQSFFRSFSSLLNLYSFDSDILYP